MTRFFSTTRRSAVLAALLLVTGLASAQDWRARYPTLVYAQGTNENAQTKMDAMAPFVDYLSKKLGVKVQLRIVNDYAAVVEGQRSGNVHIALHGASSYARAVMTGAKIEPFATDVYAGPSLGYHAVFLVKKDSPYQKVEDLKGRNLGLVDPNSTSGNTVPRYALSRMNIDPETFFAKVVYTGTHENAIFALNQGTVDVVANWWNSDVESNLTRMVARQMAKFDDYRVIFKSELIPNGPYTVLAEFPPEMKAAIAQAFFDAPREAPEAFKKAAFGSLPWARIDHKAYEGVIELNKFVDNLRRKRG